MADNARAVAFADARWSARRLVGPSLAGSVVGLVVWSALVALVVHRVGPAALDRFRIAFWLSGFPFVSAGALIARRLLSSRGHILVVESDGLRIGSRRIAYANIARLEYGLRTSDLPGAPHAERATTSDTMLHFVLRRGATVRLIAVDQRVTDLPSMVAQVERASPDVITLPESLGVRHGLAASLGNRSGTIALVVLGGGIAITVGYCEVSDWAERAERQRNDRLHDQGLPMEAALRRQLAGLRTETASRAPERCPDGVRGTVAVVQEPWRAYLAKNDPAGNSPRGVPWHMNSRVFQEMTSLTPSTEAGWIERNRGLQEAVGRRWVAVHLIDNLAPIDAGAGPAFEGGAVRGRLVVFDTGSGAAVCAREVVGQVDLVLWVAQSTPEGEDIARASASDEALASSFFKAASSSLAAMAPGATLDVPPVTP
jgi:hypothetical protein